jgi:hypothetical protein
MTEEAKTLLEKASTAQEIENAIISDYMEARKDVGK